MNKVFIDQECNLCTSYGNWISEKNKNLDISFQNDLSPEEIELDTLVYEKNGFRFYYSDAVLNSCLLYTSPSPRDVHLSRMPSSA